MDSSTARSLDDALMADNEDVYALVKEIDELGTLSAFMTMKMKRKHCDSCETI